MNASKIEQLCGFQSSILKKASGQVKDGGSLVYAVCTLTKCETTDIVEQFLASNSEFNLEGFKHPLTDAASEGMVWITPEETGGDAMFIAKMRKIG